MTGTCCEHISQMSSVDLAAEFHFNVNGLGA